MLIVLSVALLYVVVSGHTRRASTDPFTATTTPDVATSTASVVPRHLDGVPVPAGQERARPVGFMIDNQADALPWSGIDQASLVIESPVEGGITRLFALFDPSVNSSTVIGPVRSARPYFVDWAQGWQAGYGHVGGSPDALDKIRGLGASFANLDEMANGTAFYRSQDRSAPHNVYTTLGLIEPVMLTRYGTSTANFSPWRFEPLATSTDALVSSPTVRIPYGGSYSVSWKFDVARGQYVRSRMGVNGTQKTLTGAELTAANVVVIKTDAQVLDEKGRLALRTTGSGDAMIYRAGKKYVARWTRAPGELMRFEGADGSEYPLSAGTTWIELTTDDRIFAGLSVTTMSTSTPLAITVPQNVTR